ncbi:helix-turn-helix domain-containing protein [Peribacillus simplex]|uniref:helix-turn-helix domain-containing protein n=1 Tax=Peribacillus simplex TaxID=1478 RepID=UPI00366A9065
MLVPSYKPLEITLIKREKNKMNLRNELKLAPSTIAKISKNEYLHLRVLAQICDYLECPIEEVVELVPLKDHQS